MEKILEEQWTKTNFLIKALEVAKVSDDPLIEELILQITEYMKKSKGLMEKAKGIIAQKKNLYNKSEELAQKCNELAQRTEEINHILCSSQSYNTSTPFKSNDQYTNNGQHIYSLEVSPCPTEWANGALETPMAMSRQSQPVVAQVQTPSIELLHPKEMECVPAYMKGRLTTDNINTFIGILNSVIKQKYSITKLKRNKIKQKDLIQYSDWKCQEEQYNMNNKVFFTSEDLINLGKYKIIKTTDNMFQILRHTKRLRQTRVNGKIILHVLV